MTHADRADGGHAADRSAHDGHDSALGACADVSRRQFLTSLAALGAGTILPARALMAQTASPAAGMTPRRIIDVHHHFFPPFYLEAWQKAPAANESPMRPEALAWTPAKTLDQLDRNSVTTAVLSISHRASALATDAEGVRRIVRMCNEYAIQMAQDHPGRFGLFASLPMPDVEGCLKDIEYSLDVLKAEGIGLMTSYGNKWPGDPAFAPVFEELNRRKAVVYFHPLTPSCCGNLIPNVPATLAEYPHDTTRAVLSLLFSGTFSRLKDIRWIFSHAGGTVPMLAGRIRTLSSQVKNLSEFAPNGIDYELRRLYFETANSAYAPTMAALLKYVPLSQVLFGTDYPYVTAGQNLQDLHKLGLSAAQLRAIESGNAGKLMPQLKA